MEGDTEIDDILRNNTSSESGHNNEVSQIDLQLVKLQDVAKCASFLRIRIEFHLFQFIEMNFIYFNLLSCLDYVLVKFVLVL